MKISRIIMLRVVLIGLVLSCLSNSVYATTPKLCGSGPENVTAIMVGGHNATKGGSSFSYQSGTTDWYQVNTDYGLYYMTGLAKLSLILTAYLANEKVRRIDNNGYNCKYFDAIQLGEVKN